MQHSDSLQKLVRTAVILTSALVIVVAAVWGARLLIAHQLQLQAQAPTQSANSGLLGFPLQGDVAPDFTLTDQFGHTVKLSSLRGH